MTVAAAAFVFVHGIAGAFLFPVYFSAGLLIAALYLWLGRLTPVICLQAVIDMGAILAGS